MKVLCKMLCYKQVMNIVYILINRIDMSGIILYLYWVQLLHPSSPLNFGKKNIFIKNSLKRHPFGGGV